MQAPTIITGPLFAHGVRTPEEYLARQREFIAQMRAAHPAYRWLDPWDAIGRPAAFISGGRWVLMCACGNAASVDPDWRLAACFECGAIYRSIELPADRAAIEAVLLRRPEMRTRNWRLPETLAFLEAENEEHGVS